MSVSKSETVKIDPSKVPSYDYSRGCAVLFASISRALDDPKLRAEYEAWKAKG